MVGDLAFLPIEVLLVTLIIHSLLRQRERKANLEKLNMVIGVFFSEVGTKLITYFSDFDHDLDKIRKELIITGDWIENDFEKIGKRLKKYEFNVDLSKLDLNDLQAFLSDHRDLLLRLLENPNLLEHEDFTGLLRAVFHLSEELTVREELTDIPPRDYEHLTVDVHRAYSLLVEQWLDYMEYLENNYPFLFSLAMRTNPFDKEATGMVQE